MPHLNVHIQISVDLYDKNICVKTNWYCVTFQMMLLEVSQKNKVFLLKGQSSRYCYI